MFSKLNARGLTEIDEEIQAADIYFPTDSDVVLLCYAHASDFIPSARELSQLIEHQRHD